MSWGRLEQPTLRTNYGLLPRGRRILERHSTPAKKIHECVLLHVEDDDGAAYLFQTALGQTDLRQYFHVSNGEEAMAFLLQQGADSFAQRPDLVLLDLDLPQKSGRRRGGRCRRKPCRTARAPSRKPRPFNRRPNIVSVIAFSPALVFLASPADLTSNRLFTGLAESGRSIRAGRRRYWRGAQPWYCSRLPRHGPELPMLEWFWLSSFLRRAK